MSETVTVFVVTGLLLNAPVDPDTNKRDEFYRQDLAKFFTREHAEAHIKDRVLGVPGGWVQLRVEERVERVDVQHEVHQAGIRNGLMGGGR